jgi:hypothetical protein
MRFKCMAFVLAMALSACSPTLNWRIVHLQQLTALLPCKPEQAQRTVRLGAQEVQMRMAGCEADGALFAMSQVDVGVRTNVSAALAAWRAVTLDNLGGATPTALPFKVARPKLQNGHLEAVGDSGQTGLFPERVAVTGKRADGSPIQAQLAWIADGTSLYQIAVYGPRLTPDMVETLFSEIRIQ